MSKQITVKQHYAPKLHFKRFANDGGMVQALELRLNRIGRPRPYAGVCYAPFYYAVETGKEDSVSQDFEAFFTEVEDRFAKKADEIIEDIMQRRAISDEKLELFAWYMACLWIRSPTMREQLNDMTERGVKDIMQSISSFPGFAEQSREKLKEAGINATDAQIESAIEAFRDKNYKLEQNNAGHLNSIAQTEEYKRWFFAKSWRFHIANGGKQFITSDTPVIEIFNKGRTLAEQMYGNHIMQRRHFYALTPNILVELTDPLKFKKRIKRNIVSDHEVIQHNLLRAGYSKSYCYSQRRAELEDLGVYYEGGTNVKRAVAEYLRDKRRQSEL